MTSDFSFQPVFVLVLMALVALCLVAGACSSSSSATLREAARDLEILNLTGNSSASFSADFNLDDRDPIVFSFSSTIDAPVFAGAVAGVLGLPRVFPEGALTAGVTSGV
jgi:hypothetical protein